MPGGAAAPPALEVRTRRSVHQLTAGTTYSIGRDPKSNLVMTDSRVSWRHGELRVDGDGWIVEDLGSTNGTFLGPQRLDRIEIREECVVRLGNPDDGPVLRCVPQLAGRGPAARRAPGRSPRHRPVDACRAGPVRPAGRPGTRAAPRLRVLVAAGPGARASIAARRRPGPAGRARPARARRAA